MEPERIKLEGFLDEFRTAVEEEIFTIKKSGQSSTLLRAGRQLEKGGNEFRYIFKVDYMPTIPADTPCKLVLGNDRFDVSVISCDGDSIIIASSSKLPNMLGSAQLENGSTVLMELLIKCIEKNADKKNQLGKYLIRDGENIYFGTKIHSYDTPNYEESFTANQRKAVETASSYDVSYIWGPPGTGKTTVIGKIVDEIFDKGRSILIVSHTNIAVDGAIENSYESTKDENAEISPVLRLGTPVKNLPSEVLLDSHVKILGKELHEKKTILLSEKSTIDERLVHNSSLIEEDNWVKNTKLELIQETISEWNNKKNVVSTMYNDVKEAEQAVEKSKEEHPYYEKYGVLNAELNNVNEKLEHCNYNMQFYKRRKKECNEIKENASEEMRKHDIYADLKGQESKLMPLEFLRKEAEKVDKSIQDVNDSIALLNAKKTESEKTLSEYDNKGSVAKLFYSKNTIEQLKESIKVADYGISQNQEILGLKTRLLEEYKSQIQQVLLIQEKEKAVSPSNTKEYWQNVIKSRDAELEKCNKSISELIVVIEELDIRQKELKANIEEVTEEFENVSIAESKLNEARTSFENADKDAKLCYENCKNLLDEECSLCANFWEKELDNLEIQDCIKELFILKDRVEEDLEDVDIDKCKKEKEEDEKESHRLGKELGLIETKIQELELEAIRNARIVGTTLSKAFIDEKIRERTFDTVILDEASMASIPALWCASLLAEKSIVIVGDFLQLPPIYVASTELAKKWLGTDVFSHSGMKECLDKKVIPDNFVMLRDQFRMESDIAELANNYYAKYGALISNDNSKERVEKREDFYKWCTFNRTKGNVFLINTESLHAWVTGIPQGRKHSRLNSFSASISVDLAFKVIDNRLKDLNPSDAEATDKPSVIIIAPYRPHIDRVRKLIDLEYRNRGFKENLNYISAGTVHSFQGNEADVVIFDLVVDEPHRKCNLFMPDDQLDENLDNMFNVAITRAKFKLFIIGNFDYCKKHAKANSLARLLDCLLVERNIRPIDARRMFPSITFEKRTYAYIDESVGKKHLICTDGDFYEFFLSDLQSMKKRMVIYSAFMTENRVSILLPSFVDAINANKEIIVVTKALEEHGKSQAYAYQKIENELKSIGVTIIHKKGMHEKIVIVDDEICWQGSLNVLSNNGHTGEHMERYCDSLYVSDFEKVIDLDAIYQAVETKYELRCPACSNEMLIKEGADGGIYWECSNCGFSRRPKQNDPVDGEIRCTCGGAYRFSMKNEPRWVCTENQKHYQKVNRSDLRLSKMLALIPKEDQKRVENYFEEKQKQKTSVTAKVPKGDETKVKNTKVKSTVKKTAGGIVEEDGQIKWSF